MHFLHEPSRFGPTIQKPGHCYLRNDNWDDFGYQTTFNLLVVDMDGTAYEIGGVKIMKRGMGHERVVLDPEFDILDDTFCSLGQNENYYEQLLSLNNDIGEEILTALRDCVAHENISQEFSKEDAFTNSLMRYITTTTKERFRSIYSGQSILNKYEFDFNLYHNDIEDISFSVEINVIPDSKPPTNVHVVIGRNGAGKTRLLSELANSLMQIDVSYKTGMHGKIAFRGSEDESFSGLVVIAFSTLDSFVPVGISNINSQVRYNYIGIKNILEIEEDGDVQVVLKMPKDILNEFSDSLSACSTGLRRTRWRKVMEILKGDPGFGEMGIDEIDISDELCRKNLADTFNVMSSGHRFVLLTLTRLVELVDEKTLVLIDEPENHLHPPLLGSFIRALSSLLTWRNGLAIVATHSPVVLQEVPRSCVSIIRRTGMITSVDRPIIETFAENVSTLTHDVFQLEVEKSGFYKLLSDSAEKNSYEEILNIFNNQVGSEGRALARILTLMNKNQEK